MLSDSELSQLDIVDDIGPGALQPASIDLRLADDFVVISRSTAPLDPYDLPDDYWQRLQAEEYVLCPGQFVLGRTQELIRVPRTHAADVAGRSTLGRLGVLIHCTAGYVDPGFYGTVTLEIRNVGPRSIKLRAGMPIAQLRVWKLDSPPLRGYGHVHSKYYGQVETQPAKSLRRTHEGRG